MSVDDPIGPPHLPPLAARTIAHVFAQALAQRPDQIALEDPGTRLTYAQLHSQALALASGIGRLGVAPREPVLLILDNPADAVLAWLAAALSGRIEVPVNTAYKGNILAHVLHNTGARLILIEAHYLPLLAAEAERLTALAIGVYARRWAAPNPGRPAGCGPTSRPASSTRTTSTCWRAQWAN